MNKELSPNTTISHYRIVSKIGAGGMGEVYLAQDTKLDRKVALKILPADLAANQDRMRRFVQEAKAAAALNHPNIAHIYEIGESDGTNFIAMEFVDGETLREKLHQEKSELRVLLKHLLQVAEGLGKAHASGIVHRDLKPDNIMITRNWTESEREFKKAIELNPNVANNHYYYGLHHLTPNGRLDEATRELKLALELEPLSISIGTNLAWLYDFAGQKELALEQARIAYGLDPNNALAIAQLGFFYSEKEMYVDAIALIEKSLQTDPMTQKLLTVAGIAYARTNQRQKAEEMVARFREIAKTQYVSNYFIAMIYSALGERDKAFAELEQALLERDPQLNRLKLDPFLAPLRDDPRFAGLLKRMGLPE